MAFLDNLKNDKLKKVLVVELSYLDSKAAGERSYLYFSTFPTSVKFGNDGTELLTEPRIDGIPEFLRAFEPITNNVVTKATYKIKLANGDRELNTLLKTKHLKNQPIKIYACIKTAGTIDLNDTDLCKVIATCTVTNVEINDYVQLSLNETSVLDLLPDNAYFLFDTIDTEDILSNLAISDSEKEESMPYLLGKVDKFRGYCLNALSSGEYYPIAKGYIEDSVTGYHTFQTNTTGGFKEYDAATNGYSLTKKIGSGTKARYNAKRGYKEFEFLQRTEIGTYQFGPGYGPLSDKPITDITLEISADAAHDRNTKYFISSDKTQTKITLKNTTSTDTTQFEFNSRSQITIPNKNWSWLEQGDLLFIEGNTVGTVHESLSANIRIPLKIDSVNFGGTNTIINLNTDYKIPLVVYNAYTAEASSSVPSRDRRKYNLVYNYVQKINLQDRNNTSVLKDDLSIDHSYFIMRSGTADDAPTYNTTARYVYPANTGNVNGPGLLFKSLTSGAVGNNFKVSFVNGGSSTPSVTFDGSYIYTFTFLFNQTNLKRIVDAWNAWGGVKHLFPPEYVNLGASNPKYVIQANGYGSAQFLTSGTTVAPYFVFNTPHLTDKNKGIKVMLLLVKDGVSSVTTIETRDILITASFSSSNTQAEIAAIIAAAINAKAPMIAVTPELHVYAEVKGTDQIIIRNLQTNNTDIYLDFKKVSAGVFTSTKFDKLEESQEYNIIESEEIDGTGNHIANLDYIGCVLGSGNPGSTDNQGLIAFGAATTPWDYTSLRAAWTAASTDQSVSFTPWSVCKFRMDNYSTVGAIFNKVISGSTDALMGATSTTQHVWFTTPNEAPYANTNYTSRESKAYFFENDVLTGGSDVKFFYKDEFSNVGKLIEKLFLIHGLTASDYSVSDLNIFADNSLTISGSTIITPSYNTSYLTGFYANEKKNLYENLNIYLASFALAAFVDQSGVIRVKQLDLIRISPAATTPATILYPDIIAVKRDQSQPEYSRVKTNYRQIEGGATEEDVYYSTFLEGSLVNFNNEKNVNSAAVNHIFNTQYYNGITYNDLFNTKFLQPKDIIEIKLPLEYVVYDLMQTFVITGHPDFLETDVYVLYDTRTDLNFVEFKMIRKYELDTYTAGTHNGDYLITDLEETLGDDDTIIIL